VTTKFFDLMIDLETAGGPPDGALMQIGAVFFDLQTQTLGPQFLQNVHLATAVNAGGKIDPATFIWWLGQSDKAREVRFNGRAIVDVLNNFRIWIGQTCRLEDVRVYGNGASFDLTILGSAYKRSPIDVPWRYGNERCFRTVRNLYPSVEYDYASKGEDAHNALHDAVFQVQHMFKIKNSVARREPVDA
jgi:hypothetical protein